MEDANTCSLLSSVIYADLFESHPSEDSPSTIPYMREGRAPSTVLSKEVVVNNPYLQSLLLQPFEPLDLGRRPLDQYLWIY